MPEYRTPEEERETDEHRERVQHVLDEAARNATSVITAITLGEPEEVIDQWVNRLWDGLRENLSDNHPDNRNSPLRAEEDRLLAIVMLLEPRARREADAVIASVTP